MKYFIAGGTGLIGTALAESLLGEGHEVRILSRNPHRVAEAYQAYSWEETSLTAGVTGAEVVINLAGASLAGNHLLDMRWTPKRKREIIASRVKAGQALLQAISGLERKPEVFVQASAIGFYGNQGLEPANENSPPGGDFLAQVCREWEEASAGLEQQGIRRLVVRIGLVLSSTGGLLPTLALPFRFFVGGRIGSGSQYLSWIHLKDVVGSIKYLIEDPTLQGYYNLSAPNPATNQDFSAALGRTLRRPAWLPLPAPAMRLFLGEAATLALDGRPVYPARLLQAGYPFIFPELKVSLRDLLGAETPGT